MSDEHGHGIFCPGTTFYSQQVFLLYTLRAGGCNRTVCILSDWQEVKVQVIFSLNYSVMFIFTVTRSIDCLETTCVFVVLIFCVLVSQRIISIIK